MDQDQSAVDFRRVFLMSKRWKNDRVMCFYVIVIAQL